MPVEIGVKELTKTFGSQTVWEDLTCDIPKSKITVMLGPSGTGKSVFLKGVSEAGARDILKQLYVNKNKSEQGIEEYIKSAGAKIGQ